MKPQSMSGKPNTRQAGLIALVGLVALVAGTTALAYPRPYFPLVVGGIIAATVVIITWLRTPVWALYAALFVVLLPTGLIPLEVHSIINRTVTVVALAAYLFDVLARHRQVQWTGTAVFMLSFVAWCAVTLLWADNMSMATIKLGGYALRLILFLFLIPTQIRTRETLNGLMGTLALNGWVLLACGAETILQQGYTTGTRLRVLGADENLMGVLTLVTMVGVLWQVLQPSPRHKQLKKLASWLFLLGAIILVAASGSRGSATSLLVILLAFCFWRPTRPWGVLGLLALALGIALAPFLFSTTLERFAVVPGDTFLGGREAIWQACWRLALDHPWGGVGIGNAPFAVIPYLQSLRSVRGHESASIHSPLLAIWAETGLLGILLYLGVLVSAVWSFGRQYLQHLRVGIRSLTTYFALVSSVFLGFMFSWIVGGNLEESHVYFLILALLVVPSCLVDIEGSEAG